ncbi:MAG TPA: hypothetical protein VII28_05610 [Puia sp.]
MEMSMHQIWLYDLFRKELRLTDDKAAAFVKAIEDVAESEGARKNHLLATKDDIQDIKSDVQVLRGDMQVLRGDLELKIEQSKNDVYRAMFISGIVQLIAILSGTLAIVKFTK